MKKRILILVLVPLLFFILTSSGWSKPWPHYIRYGHGWEDVCAKPITSDGYERQTYGMIKFSISPLFVVFKVMPQKTTLKAEGGNKQDVKFSNSNSLNKKWTNNLKAVQKR